MAYIIKLVPKGSADGNNVILKLNRDKSLPLHEDIARLVNDNQRELVNRFGYRPLDAFVKLKDDQGWKLICDLKLSY